MAELQRKLLKNSMWKTGKHMRIYAKVETPEAV